jgi:poly(hydroxyalkanoate) granule-associated protein
MLKKARADAKASAQDELSDFAKGIRESSRQIWLAGLGAFSRATGEGLRMFETLVEQGQHLESRTKRAASETAAAAAGAAAQKAKEVQAMAGGTWDKLEQVFEDRVARALSKLGVHTQADVERLARRVEALSEAVNELIKSGAVPAGTRATGTKRASRKRATSKGDSAPAKPRASRKSGRRKPAGQGPA